jgi:hypothetical protein
MIKEVPDLQFDDKQYQQHVFIFSFFLFNALIEALATVLYHI